MSVNRTIEIIIGTTGKIHIDAVGFKGPDCEQATRFLEEALGVIGSMLLLSFAAMLFHALFSVFGALPQVGDDCNIVGLPGSR